MAKLMLADLSDGESMRTLAYLKQKRLVPYRNKPGAFLALTLADRSGTLEGKVFDDAEGVASGLREGQVVRISGRGSFYQGQPGIVLDAVAPCDDFDPADFLPTYSGDVRMLEAKLDAFVASLRDADLSALVRSILTDPELRRRYLTAPAAKGMHGAYLHGLLEHVVRVAELADAACAAFPQANRDLVITGVLLHDLGKVREFTWDINIEYTEIGRLQAHSVIGDRIIYEHGRQLGIAEHTALQVSHLILSHHGVHEFGAVVLPQTLEAVILHAVDNLEAKATHCIEAMAKGDGIWSEYDRMEGRFWYRGEVVSSKP